MISNTHRGEYWRASAIVPHARPYYTLLLGQGKRLPFWTLQKSVFNRFFFSNCIPSTGRKPAYSAARGLSKSDPIRQGINRSSSLKLTENIDHWANVSCLMKDHALFRDDNDLRQTPCFRKRHFQDDPCIGLSRYRGYLFAPGPRCF